VDEKTVSKQQFILLIISKSILLDQIPSSEAFLVHVVQLWFYILASSFLHFLNLPLSQIHLTIGTKCNVLISPYPSDSQASVFKCYIYVII
jgi:hypothetical protein